MTDVVVTQPRESVAGFGVGTPGITPPSDPDRRGVFLDDVVVELGLADRETIDLAVQSAQHAEQTFERYVLESGILNEDQLSRAVAERNGLDHVDLDRFTVDTGVAEMVTRSAAERYRAVPIAFAADGAVIAAVEDPFDSLGLSDIEAITRSEVRPAIAAASGIRALIEKLPEQAPPRPSPIIEETEKREEPAADAAEPEPVVVAVPEPMPVEMLQIDQEPEQTTEEEPVVEDEIVVDLETAMVDTPTPVETPVESGDDAPQAFEPQEEVASEGEPAAAELASVPSPETDAVGLARIERELGSLQESTRRADGLAGDVERRINELKSADERSVQLEADLNVAQRRVEELEEQISGVDTLAEELRETTTKLEEVNRVLEGSVG